MVKLSSLSSQELKALKEEYRKQVCTNVMVFQGKKYYVSDIADYIHSLRRRLISKNN